MAKDEMGESDVESLRRDIGEKMARDGEGLHDNASDSVRQGFRRGSIGFGTNVLPRNFARTGEARSDWTCACGHVNSGRTRFMVAKREVCELCRVEREYSQVD
jgi:hypothetical protein